MVEVGSRVRFEGRTWTVAALVGGQVRLTAENGEMAALLLSLLFAGEGFEVVDGPAARRVAPLGLLDSLPATVRERALAWEGHVREVETGHPGGSGEVGPARAEYAPGARTLAQREEAKAAEQLWPGDRETGHQALAGFMMSAFVTGSSGACRSVRPPGGC